MDRAGIVGADGPTSGYVRHTYLRCLPNMVLMAPKMKPNSSRWLLPASTTDGPIAMRPRGNGYGVPLMEEGWEALPIGR